MIALPFGTGTYLSCFCIISALSQTTQTSTTRNLQNGVRVQNYNLLAAIGAMPARSAILSLTPKRTPRLWHSVFGVIYNHF